MWIFFAKATVQACCLFKWGKEVATCVTWNAFTHILKYWLVLRKGFAPAPSEPPVTQLRELAIEIGKTFGAERTVGLFNTQ